MQNISSLILYTKLFDNILYNSTLFSCVRTYIMYQYIKRNNMPKLQQEHASTEMVVHNYFIEIHHFSKVIGCIHWIHGASYLSKVYRPVMKRY